MGMYFCDKLVLKKEALKMAYICKQTKKICPRVKYSVDGEASPDVLYTLKGCALNKKEEKVVEEVKAPVVEVVVEEIKEVEPIVETAKVEEEIVETVVEEVKEVEVKSEQKENTPKQVNYNKKKKKNYNNQNRNQEQQ